MKHVRVLGNRSHFKVVAEGSSSQAAMMTLRPGQSSSDEPENEHPRAEQWVLVISGRGRVKTRGPSVAIRRGSLVLIEKSEAHQISNTGRGPLVTVNFYAPAAYTGDGEVKRSVKGK
jgi:mannose-6-phosphate isomerase-like protein (cupin superfamily)